MILTEISLWVKMIMTEISLWVKMILTEISLWLKIILTERVNSRTKAKSNISFIHKISLCFCRDILSLAENLNDRDPLFN